MNTYMSKKMQMQNILLYDETYVCVYTWYTFGEDK